MYIGRAWTWQRKGEPLELELTVQNVPEPGPDEVLVKNRVVGLNPVDWKIVEWGHPEWRAGHVPGVDGAGTIVSVGRNVSLKIGEHVAYHQDIARCGSFAVYTCVDVEAIIPVPAELTFRIAASFPCPGLTAWQALEKVPFVPDQDVLVVGAGGAVGFYLAQLASKKGYRVWATAGAKHRTILLSLGVTDVVDYRESGWRDSLTRLLGSRKLAAVFDTANEEHAQSFAPLLAYNGHIVCIQTRLNTPAAQAFTTAISQHEVALNAIHHYGTPADWQRLRHTGVSMLQDLAAGSLLSPQIIEVAFDELPQALTSIKAGSHSGKYVALLS